MCSSLVPGHCYTILSAYEIAGGTRLLQIRNPWGNYEWNGDWSDKSPLWTPEVVAQVEADLSGDDGLFWMVSWSFICVLL